MLKFSTFKTGSAVTDAPSPLHPVFSYALTDTNIHIRVRLTANLRLHTEAVFIDWRSR